MIEERLRKLGVVNMNAVRNKDIFTKLLLWYVVKNNNY
jgi:hypothetical protein